MTAERGDWPSPIISEICFLDFTFEKLGFILSNEKITKAITDWGFEGDALVKGLESFFQGRDQNAEFEPTDASNIPILRIMFTYRLPVEIIDSIHAFTQSLDAFDAKNSNII